jgi:hypothetical protein
LAYRATWALFIKVGFRAFILLKKILLKFQNFENKIDMLKTLGCPKVIKTLFKKIIFNYYTTSFNSLWISNQHKQFIHFFFTFQKLEKNWDVTDYHP